MYMKFSHLLTTALIVSMAASAVMIPKSAHATFEFPNEYGSLLLIDADTEVFPSAPAPNGFLHSFNGAGDSYDATFDHEFLPADRCPAYDWLGDVRMTYSQEFPLESDGVFHIGGYYDSDFDDQAA